MEHPKRASELTLLINSYSDGPKDGDLLKGHIVAHFRNRSRDEFHEYVKPFYGDTWTDSLKNALNSAAVRIDRNIRKDARNIQKPDKSAKIVELLREKFLLPVSREKSVPPMPRKRKLSEVECSPNSVGGSSGYESSPCLSTLGTPTSLHPPRSVVGTPDTSRSEIYQATPKRFKPCLECRDLRREKVSLRKELNQTKKLTNSLHSKRKRKLKFQPKRLNQKIKRLTVQNVMLRAKSPKVGPVSQELVPLVSQVNALRSEVKRLSKQKREIQRYHNNLKSSTLTVQLANVQAENKSLKEKNTELENNLLELEEKLNDTAPIPTMDGKQFDVKTRKCINYCLQNNVSHESASGIVDYVVREMTGKALQRLPKPTTNANIAREFGELSNIQCGEALAQDQTKNVTMGFDGTTKGGKKINDFHAVTAEGALTLSIDRLPGGKAVDCATHLREGLSDVSTAYSNYSNTDNADTTKKIHNGMHNFFYYY